MIATNSILCGDCFIIMQQMDNDSIACCITDPPYNYEFIGRSWDEKEINRRLDKVKNSNSTLLLRLLKIDIFNSRIFQCILAFDAENSRILSLHISVIHA